MPVPLIWLIFALLLAGAEALTGDLFLLMLSGGALAAAGTSWLFGWPIWADGVVFLGASVLLLVLVRPALRRRFALGTGPSPEPVRALEGKQALVLDQVTRHGGQIRLDGEVWTARPMNADDVYEAGDQVTVVEIDGATALVWKNGGI
ncbi:NfeD family protein [Mycolicibacterium thermoresistibile]